MGTLRLLLLGLALTGSFAQASDDGTEPLDGLLDYSAGRRQTCAIRTGGALWCWGGSTDGQIGDGDYIDRVSPVPVTGLGSGVVAVAPGDAHTCALMDGGTVKCWGGNQGGALGLGSTSTSLSTPTPVDVPSLSGIRALATAAIGRRTCAISTANEVYCWGRGISTPVRINDANGGNPIPLANVDTVAVSGSFACALISDGKVKCWGRNDFGIFGPPDTSNRVNAEEIAGLAGTTAFSIAAGVGHMCAALGTGEVRCWGDNSSGQLGRGSEGEPEPVPMAVLDLPSVGTGDRLIPGWQHSCLQRSSGELYCWGANGIGEFGNGDSVSSPRAVLALGGRTDIGNIRGAFQHSCGTDGEGALLCWGRADNGQLGTSATTDKLFPQRISMPTPVAFGHGLNHACAIDAEGSLRCWGANYEGQLGDGSKQRKGDPQLVPGLAAQVQVVGGVGHTCVRNQAGEVRCWGSNLDGQLGLGSSGSAQTTPQAAVALGGNAIDLSSGAYHVCALLEGGSVKCWGGNAANQLGSGGTLGTSSPTPLAITGLPAPASAISAGDYHVCALLDDHRIACWGDNSSGQLGADPGTTSSSTTPLLVPGISTASALSVGSSSSCALLDSGEVRCWGDNYLGLLGDGSSLPSDPTYYASATPVTVAGLPGPATAISLGSTYVGCALVAGQGWCWGWNLHGPVGDGSSRIRRSAAAVALPGETLQRLVVGGLHTCAVASSDKSYCWGWNIEGQVGTGDYSYSTRPERVLVDTAARAVERLTTPLGKGGAVAAETEAVASGNGAYMVFTQQATGGTRQLMRRNLRTGTVESVSVDSGEVPLVGDAIEASSSADGNLVLFVAAKPVGKNTQIKGAWPKGGTSSPYGVFLRNMLTGTTTAIANARSTGSDTRPQISADGSQVVLTRETDPGEGQPGLINVFSVPLVALGGGEVGPGSGRCETCKTVLADGSSSATDSAGASEAPVLSADGQWLAFQSASSNLLSTPSNCPGASSAVLMRNLLTGATRRISDPASGGSCGNGGAVKPSIDYAGQSVVFVSAQPLAAGDNNGGNDVYLYKPTTGIRQVSVGAQGSALGEIDAAVISGNGQTVAFVSSATNLDASDADNNDSADVYVQRLRDRRLARLGKNPRGTQVGAASQRPSLDYSGKSILFDSTAGNLSDAAVDGEPAIYKRANSLATGYVFDAGFE